MPFLWTVWSHHTMCKKVVIYHRPHAPHILMIMCAICHKSMTFCVYTILGFHSSRALKLQILFRSPSVERIGKHIYQETISVPVDLDVQYLERGVRGDNFAKCELGGNFCKMWVRWQFCKRGSKVAILQNGRTFNYSLSRWEPRKMGGIPPRISSNWKKYLPTL